MGVMATGEAVTRSVLIIKKWPVIKKNNKAIDEYWKKFCMTHAREITPALCVWVCVCVCVCVCFHESCKTTSFAAYRYILFSE
jgi:hypothetical protein